METCAFRLSEEQLALLPTEADIAFYEEHGWYISKQILPDELLDTAILGSERYYRGERDTPLLGKNAYSDWKPEDKSFIRNNEFVSLQNKQLHKLGFYPIIAAIAARLSRTKRIRLFADSLLCKLPTIKDSHNGVVGWHTDKAYWSTCSSDKLLTAWIPFQNCDESLGPLIVIDGSHKWKDTHLMKNFFDPNLNELEEKFRQQGKQITKVPMTIQKGQVSFHHCLTIHGSSPNYSDSLRLAMAVHMQDDGNHYRPFWNQKGEQIHIGYEALCRKLHNGHPDFSDPALFPILWSEIET
ncbi:phytanoyl-CoA dioxygenase family protein [Chroococcidiopsis sp. FACHB-1243]|uniref:phytanoyl-CoA dioxygenase family protein n=1 Tax=Chroococcidiopsis sp. [FACHB-1243] TaxID=2692781 RepID=UPI001782263D|nr:phytanoyl-CoA dioxygenase family protein [Chroococcidiopsis sp. [FACHB-1243]]MBD2308790.1 phytanoyl-CoA dioxygenase family protein [Chroococcidiopsis sp. [FACHB-1243]]